MKTSAIVTIQFLIAVTLPTYSWSQSSCSETNDNNDATCSISCAVGQSAMCTHASGSSLPSCTCSGAESENIQARYFKLVGRKNFVASAIPDAPPSLENTDLRQVINARLAQLPPRHLADSCQPGSQVCTSGHVHCFHGDCIDVDPVCHVTPTVCTPVNGSLTISGAFLVAKGPSVGLSEPNWNTIPASVFGQKGSYKNCGSVQQSQTFSHRESLTIGETVTKTKTIQTGSSNTTSISGSIKVGIPGFDLGGGVSSAITVKTDVTYTDTNSETYTKTQEELIQLPLVVPAKTIMEIAHTFIQYQVPLPFNGIIVVDANLSPNLENLHLLSDVLPNESDRTFTFSGFVNDSTLVDTQTSVMERKPTALECPAGSSITSQRLVNSRGFFTLPSK